MITMLKDSTLKILEDNNGLIKQAFDIDDNGISKIRNLLSKDRKNFKNVVDDIFLSDIGDREKTVAYYLIGYANGVRERNARKSKKFA